MTQALTIAVPKGYLLQETVKCFEKIGVQFPKDFESSRRLYTEDLTGTYKLLTIRPWDVPAYVTEGAADIGIVGQDVLLEQQPDVFVLKDLQFGGCKLVVAGPDNISIDALPQYSRVATKYPASTARYFNKIGKKVSITKLYGAIELGPLTGLCDVICDLTATGKTLEEHELHVLDTVFESTAHLIANKVGMKIHYDKIKSLTESLER